MNLLFGGLLILLFSTNLVWATELVNVPKGKIEAIWLSPVSKKAKSKSNQVVISVDSFNAQAFPVTVAQFKEFLIVHPEWSKNNVNLLFKDEYYLRDLGTAPEKAPVTFVTWFAAKAYCDAFGLRLPTINEWEYAAAASESKKNANREEKFLRRILNWYGEPQGARLKDVGSIYKNM